MTRQNMAWHGTPKYGMARQNMTWHGMAWHGATLLKVQHASMNAYTAWCCLPHGLRQLNTMLASKGNVEYQLEAKLHQYGSVPLNRGYPAVELTEMLL